MSDVKTRPAAPRGRGSGRGGRGGHSTRGRGGRPSHTKQDAEAPNFDEEGEIGQLKSRYYSDISTVKEIYPDWTDEDIAFALQETDGDLQSTIERIASGKIMISTPLAD